MGTPMSAKARRKSAGLRAEVRVAWADSTWEREELASAPACAMKAAVSATREAASAAKTRWGLPINITMVQNPAACKAFRGDAVGSTAFAIISGRQVTSTGPLAHGF